MSYSDMLSKTTAAFVALSSVADQAVAGGYSDATKVALAKGVASRALAGLSSDRATLLQTASSAAGHMLEALEMLQSVIPVAVLPRTVALIVVLATLALRGFLLLAPAQQVAAVKLHLARLNAIRPAEREELAQ